MSGIETRRGAANGKLVAGAALLFSIIILVAVFWNTSGKPSDGSTRNDSPFTESGTTERRAPETPQPRTTTEAPTASPAATTPAVATATKPSGAVYTGQVISAVTRQPIEGAQVALRDTPDRQIISSTETDQEGRYRINQASTPSGNSPEVTFSAEGYATISWPMRNPALLPAVTELQPGGSISGVVVDTDDRPIAHATVGPMVPTIAAHAAIYTSGSLTTTDADGRFTLEGMPLNWRNHVTAHAKGYSLDKSTKPTQTGATDVRIVLVKGEAVLRGIVTENGEPVRAEVRATQVYSEPHQRALALPREIVETEADGSFRFDDLSIGLYSISAKGLSPDRPRNHSVTIQHNTVSGQEGVITIELPAPKEAWIKIVDSESDTPFPSVQVGELVPFTETDEMIGNPVYTNKDGEARLMLYAPNSRGVYTIAVDVPRGYQVSHGVTGVSRRFGTRWVNPDELSETEPFIISLQRGRFIRGRVITEDNQPVANADIQLRTHTHMVVQGARYGSTGVRSDELGRFEILMIYDGNIALKAETKDSSGITMIEKVPDVYTEDTVITTTPLGRISGKVKDATGTPVTGISINAMRIEIFEGGGSSATFLPQYVVSDDDGYYEFIGLSEALYHFELIESTLGDLVSTGKQRVQLKHGEDKQDVDFIVESSELLTGMITNKRGEPVSGAYVSVGPPASTNSIRSGVIQVRPSIDFNPISTRSSSTGLYELKMMEVPEGTILRVFASQSGYLSYDTEVVFPRGEIAIVLEDLPEGKVRVIDAYTGEPVKNVRYSIETATQGLRQSLPKNVVPNLKEGVFSYTYPGAGVYNIIIEELDGSGEPTGSFVKAELPYSHQLPNLPDGIFEVKISRPIEFKGRIVAQEGDRLVPVTGAEIRIETDTRRMSAFNPPQFIAPTTSSADGSFSFKDLAPGTHYLTANAEGFTETKSKPITLPFVPEEGDSDVYTLVMDRGATIKGVVLDEERNPLRGYRVSYLRTLLRGNSYTGVSISADGTATAQGNKEIVGEPTDAEGRFELTDLPTDRGSLLITDPDKRYFLQLSQNPTSGETKELTVIYPHIVRVYGKILINGKEAEDLPLVIFNGQHPIAGRISERIKPNTDGSGYEIYLPVTSYTVESRGVTNAGQVAEVTIPEGIDEYEFDIEYFTYDVTIVLVFPENEDVTAGSFNVEQDGRQITTFVSTGLSTTFTGVNLEEAVISFKSSNKRWQGTSDPITPKRNEMNYVTIDVKPVGESVEEALRNSGYEVLGSFPAEERRGPWPPGR